MTTNKVIERTILICRGCGEEIYTCDGGCGEYFYQGDDVHCGGEAGQHFCDDCYEDIEHEKQIKKEE